MRPERRWQKTDPGLRDHPSFLDLVAELDSTPIMVDGLLHGLWSMAFKMAPDGDLTRFKPRALARSVGWPGNGDVLVTSLVDTGFLCYDGDKLLIHDWEDWGGALFAEREATKNRVSRHRELPAQIDSVTVTQQLPAVTERYSRAKTKKEKEKEKELNPPTPLVEKARKIIGWVPRDDDNDAFSAWLTIYPEPQIERTIHQLLVYQAGNTNGKRYHEPRRALANWLKRQSVETPGQRDRLTYQDVIDIDTGELAWFYSDDHTRVPNA